MHAQTFKEHVCAQTGRGFGVRSHRTRKAMLFELKMEVGGMTGMIAPPLVDNPIWSIEMTISVWLRAPQMRTSFQKASFRKRRGELSVDYLKSIDKLIRTRLKRRVPTSVSSIYKALGIRSVDLCQEIQICCIALVRRAVRCLKPAAR